MESIIDLILKALPNWVDAWWHSQADVLITATPQFGAAVVIPAMAIISCFLLLFIMEVDSGR